MPDLAIDVRNVSKAYRIWGSPFSRISAPTAERLAAITPVESIKRWGRRYAASRCQEFWALKDVSLQVFEGESIGIIGRNGSGKSTLLQIIAGTLQPSRGTIEVAGTVGALLELGSGFNPEFTGRENVRLNAAVLGLTSRQVDERFDDIAAFADIGDFMEQPVKTYSSGMFVRLAFAVQTAVDPKILIVDEALSVGDVFFQQRCYARMRKLLEEGVCVVLATHDMGAVQQFCQRTFLLKQGALVFQGPSSEATKVYFQVEQKAKTDDFVRQSVESFSATSAGSSDQQEPIPQWPAPEAMSPASTGREVGNGWARCSCVALCSNEGEPKVVFRQGETLAVFYEFEILRDMEFCFGCISIRNEQGVAVYSKITLQDGIQTPMSVRRGTRMRFRQDVELLIACVDYTLDVCLGMIPSALLTTAGLSYHDYINAELRICERHGIASFSVRLRERLTPFQLLHFGMADLPSSSAVEILPPAL